MKNKQIFSQRSNKWLRNSLFQIDVTNLEVVELFFFKKKPFKFWSNYLCIKVMYIDQVVSNMI